MNFEPSLPMYQVIARKYRPQSFDDVLNQEHINTTLRNAIAQNRIAHGYIFSGQRGTGKTTTARIVARCLNCEKGPTDHPCGVCASCLEVTAGGSVDVIEIDAASNRGINEMRELRENVRYQPARDRYKIFIVDEAHQITSEAFNALLKTIEEPPPWAVFILCTTESHKIPATIASRCQHFSFRSVDFNDLIDRMREICVAGRHRGRRRGAFRHRAVRRRLGARFAFGARSGHRLLREQARSRAGACAAGRVFARRDGAGYRPRWQNQDGGAVLSLVDELERNGGSPQHFSRELSRYLRNLLVTRISGRRIRGWSRPAPRERAEMARIAAAFSEEDLTRYLQTGARSLPRSAVLPAAAVPSRDRVAQDGAGRQADLDRRRAGFPRHTARRARTARACTAASLGAAAADAARRRASASLAAVPSPYRRLARETARRSDRNRPDLLGGRDRAVRGRPGQR